MQVGLLAVKLGITKLSGVKVFQNNSGSSHEYYSRNVSILKGGYLDTDCKLWTNGTNGDKNQAQAVSTGVHYKIVSIDLEKSINPNDEDIKPTIVAELVKYTPIETITYTKGSNYYGKISSTDVNYKTTNCRNDDGYFYIYTGIE